MDTFLVPLISPLSGKYYNYALDEANRKHYRALDIRHCLELICDEIIVEFVSDADKKAWNNSDYDLHRKLKAAKPFLGKKTVDRLIQAKILGNTGVHKGEEGDYTEEDIEKATEAIRSFSLDVFLAYFKHYGFEPYQHPWVPTVFSTLPPIYRIQILEKYYLVNPSPFVIDKLSKAYLKNGEKEKAQDYLLNCCNKKQLTTDQYNYLKNDIALLFEHIHRFPIAKNLSDARENFNQLLSSIDEEKRNSFVCLISTILNGCQSSEETIESTANSKSNP